VLYRYAVTVWYFNDVERQQARQRYALQDLSMSTYLLTVILHPVLPHGYSYKASCARPG